MDFRRPGFENYGNRIPPKMIKNKAIQKKDIKLLIKCAEKLGLRLENFRTEDRLELYWDVLQDDKALCYLSKGWGDSGFRLGEYIDVDYPIADFKNDFYEIFKICSSNFVSVYLKEGEGCVKGIGFEACIYQEGFNKKVFAQVLENFTDVLNKARKYIL